MLKRDASQVSNLDLPAVQDLFRAMLELALARVMLHSQRTRDIIAAGEATQASPPPPGQHSGSLVERVAFAIPRVAARVPWRADCLVQALAARRWLGQSGIATDLIVGVRKGTAAPFESHAWLKAGDRIVIGGSVEGFVPLTRPA